MMAAQRHRSMPHLPPRIDREKQTKKELLYSDILALLENNEVAWNGVEAAHSHCVPLVQALVDCLWYIDGRHHVFEAQGCRIPEFFISFHGYNVPEASKHRKRSVGNMSYDHLQTLSSALCRRLEASYWKQRQFVAFKQHVDMLAGNIAQYCDYIKSQSKKMKLVHSSETSVGQVSDSLIVEVLKGSSTCFPCLNDLSTALQRMDTYYHLSVNEFCPPEAQPRYRFLQQLKCGLNVPIVLLTYSPGNNKGNLQFAWRYDHSEAIETVFQEVCLS